MADTYAPHESTSAATDYRKLLKCGALLPHETSCAMPMHRNKMPAAALNTAQGAAQADLRHFILHEIRPAVCKRHSKAAACGPWSVRTRSATIANRPMTPHRPHAAGLTSARIARPTNRQIKKPAGTQTDPGRSAVAAFVASRAAWRP